MPSYINYIISMIEKDPAVKGKVMNFKSTIMKTLFLQNDWNFCQNWADWSSYEKLE